MQPHTNVGNVRHIVLVLAAMVVAMALGALLLTGDEQRTDAQTAERPNFVVVMTDDLDKQSMNQLDGIRAVMGSNGITFENSFVNYALCCPSRATFFRGQYPHNHDITSGSWQMGESRFRQLGRDQSTVATWLNDAGYQTKYLGKYLNGYLGLYIPPGWDEWFALQGNEANNQVNDDGQSITLTGNSTDVFAQEASDFILRSSTNPEPFFVMVGTRAPHRPPEVPQRYLNSFATTVLPKPSNFDEEDVSDKPQWVKDFPPLTQSKIDIAQKLYRQRLRSMLPVEDLLRQVIATLEQTGELENTYIVFTSDNGFHMGQHRLLPGDKKTPYEEDIRVPLIVRGPGVPAGSVRQELVLNNDFAPTIAELADASTPDFVDGRSFAPLLTGSEPYTSRSAFLEEGWEPVSTHTPTHKGVHTQDHMFVEYVTGEHELYDLKADPYQLESLPQADNQQLYSQMQSRLDALRSCSGAICRANEWDTKVVSTIPNANATAVAPTANVQATFSEEMMVSFINTTTFKLLQKGSTTKIGAALSYDTSTDTATLDPNEPLKSGVTYKAILSTGAKDAAGNPLDQNSSIAGLQQKAWLFTVSN
jgi:arylsulfatase A-like enzyme